MGNLKKPEAFGQMNGSASGWSIGPRPPDWHLAVLFLLTHWLAENPGFLGLVWKTLLRTKGIVLGVFQHSQPDSMLCPLSLDSSTKAFYFSQVLEYFFLTTAVLRDAASEGQKD